MIDLTKLTGQGRAFSPARAWTPEELDALIRLETERGIGRLKAADYIRNGVVTLEDYDKAVKAEFVPKTLDEVAANAEASLKDHKFATADEEPKEKKGKK